MITLLCVIIIASILCIGAAFVMYVIFKDDQDV